MSQSTVLCKCGRGKKCPEVVETPEGFVIFDDDQPGKPRLSVTHEQADLLVEWWLRKRGLVP